MADDRNSPLKDETDGSRVTQPYFQKNEMEIESGYPSESDAQATSLNKYGRPMETYDPLNESKLSYAPLLKVRALQDSRFKIFHSLGFQGNPNDALDLICVTLRGLEFVSTINHIIFIEVNSHLTYKFCCVGLASSQKQRLQTQMQNPSREGALT